MTHDDTYSMLDLEKDVRDNIREEWDNIREERFPDDYVTEIAEGWVPLYTYDLLQFAANELSLAVNEPELGPAFDGAPTPVNIIAANIYDWLVGAARSELDALQREAGNE